MKKIINELPMIGLGSGLATTGVSLAVIGFEVVKKNMVSAGVCMAFGAYLAYAGSYITIGAVERARGLR